VINTKVIVKTTTCTAVLSSTHRLYFILILLKLFIFIFYFIRNYISNFETLGK